MASRNGNEYLHEADDDFLECRGLGHAWNREGSYYEGRQVWIVLHCGRCDSYALCDWTRSGQRNGRDYRYVDGYLNKTGKRFKRTELRAELLQRTKWSGGGAEFDRLLERLDTRLAKAR